MENQRKKQSFVDENQMMAAIKELSERTMTLHEASMYYGILKPTLYYRFKQAKKEMENNRELILHMGLKNCDHNNKFATKQVLTVSQERMLVEYLLTCARMNYGLTLSTTRELAYQFAIREGRIIPDSWSRDQKAGREWARCFLKRHKEIALRKPENTSLLRNASFNRESVCVYFKNLKDLMDKHGFRPERIYNLDETGLNTVMRPPKVIAGKNIKQVGLCVSGERGETVTIVGIVNAAGDFIPPVIIFPRKRSHPDYLDGSVEGAISLFNQKGYMDTHLFLKTLEHIKDNACVSMENPILLILDNHSSHLSLEAIRYCREHGIYMLTLPPHTSHKTQPLDLTVFGPFKSHCVAAFAEWTREKEGNRISVKNIARISARPFLKSFSQSNIKSGFRAGGICPLDSQKLFKFFEDKEPYAASTNARVASNEPDFVSTDDVFEAQIALNENEWNFTFSCDDANRQDIPTVAVSSNDSIDSPSILQSASNSSISLFPQAEEICHNMNPLKSREELRSMSPGEANTPLDLSMRSSSPCTSFTSQLRFGGLEIIKPLPNPPLRHSSKRTMVSTIVTGSPELKRREEMEKKKRTKEDNKQMKNLTKGIKQTINKNQIPNTEMLPKKRGRPRKLPLSEIQI
ncbi:uncharacterized protein LOC129808928 [Phlebotomus papatasi]|uniref:uncharacterized protein LOC129808928 n=1 Tax=Phlebotomus papatasi TaxID=29031 RepID=UPI002483F204|nr:uncharacterized protein LOC129808928 [Phlebotomus papatasi]